VVWAKSPARFEAGTPAVVNVIAFAKALVLARRHGNDCFRQARIDDAAPDGILHDDGLGGLAGRELLANLNSSSPASWPSVKGSASAGAVTARTCSSSGSIASGPSYSNSSVLVTLVPRIELPGMARVSFGITNEPADIELLLETLGEIARGGKAIRKELRKRIGSFVETTVQKVYGEG
jgi:cysteine sulfinate desulfinase/cysteine desulfurase-like protein